MVLPWSAPTGKCSKELGAGTGFGVSPCLQKWKRFCQPRQANVLKRKKCGVPFILFGLFDPEELGAGTGHPASSSGGSTPSIPIPEH
ncbi:DNA helicase [Rossellomorea aquimaris]|uniref:DNA helicase n=1 Tax=Rossellomorea TaxID=2837508 RepID=UPI0016537E07|nr:DNA helicase [Rossellomorea aquimaris]